MKKEQVLKDIKHGGLKSLVKKALEKGVKIDFLSFECPVIKLSFQNKEIFTKKGTTPLNIRMGDLARNKELTKEILSEIGTKVPNGILASSFKEASLLIKKNKLLFPLIVKPVNSSLASGVTWNINSKKELQKAVGMLKDGRNSNELNKFMVEEMFIGDEFRILVFEGKVVSCVKKVPASIVGDGKSTIKKLIENFNKKRMRGFEIKMDDVARTTLKKNNLTLNSILDEKYNLKLRNNLNMSDGGRCIECTDAMSNKFKKICEESMIALGLSFGGIDLMAKDISNQNSNYVILEINSNPFYNMHEKPLVEGEGIDVSLMILDKLFPKLKNKGDEKL